MIITIGARRSAYSLPIAESGPVASLDIARGLPQYKNEVQVYALNLIQIFLPIKQQTNYIVGMRRSSASSIFSSSPGLTSTFLPFLAQRIITPTARPMPTPIMAPVALLT